MEFLYSSNRLNVATWLNPSIPHRMADPPIQLHALHPSPPASNRQRAYQLSDFCSGAAGQSGRFTEGLLLRRLQADRFDLSKPLKPKVEPKRRATFFAAGSVGEPLPQTGPQ